jgi:hypothetical protein
MTRWRRPDPDAPDVVESMGDHDQVARLTAKADLIVEELDVVVRQMGDLLRRKYSP